MSDLRYLPANEILEKSQKIAKFLRYHTHQLFIYLAEVDRRMLFAELSYSSLFAYLVNELKFSPSQSAIYNNIIKSRVFRLEGVCEELVRGDLSLFALGVAAQEVRKDGIRDVKKQRERVAELGKMSKSQLKERIKRRKNGWNFNGTGNDGSPGQRTVVVELDRTVVKKLHTFKTRKKLDEDMELKTVIDFLVTEKLYEKNEKKEVETSGSQSQSKQYHQSQENQHKERTEPCGENKTITPKMRAKLLIDANYQCQFVGTNGKRCTETKNLEVDHIVMKSMGGTNKIGNLRVLCKTHNLKAAYDQVKKVEKYRTGIKKSTTPGEQSPSNVEKQ